MNTTFSEPTEAALCQAEKQYRTSFTNEVFMNGFTPKNVKDHFGVSVENRRAGKSIVIDYTLTKKTGKLVEAKTVEVRDLN